ncbi:riboflavin synthase [Rubrobacter naiadicus]|uniref:riboflavin synthase n=1 Tax=Rubrobacter naiadicus TaxID=1392641 RepID=UPI002361A220|nr:riboflavin synthase [Rubrobacter naiadicus]
MFTGLVEEKGRVVALSRGGLARLVVEAGRLAGGVEVGDSVAVNGVCLTVAERSGKELLFGVMPETLRRTALGDLSEGRAVNLERALEAGGRLGGHIVQGHVDGVGEVVSIRPEGEAEIWEFSAPGSVLRYVVEKGSICVDGISLTVVSVGGESFSVSILPQTKAATDLSEIGVGTKVNLEADVMGKYVERLLAPYLEKGFERSI